MTSERNDALQTRLRRIEGQVRGLQRMVAEGQDCEDMLTQMMAIRGALEQVSALLLDHHIRGCLLADCTVDESTMRSLQHTLQIWARFGAPAAQIPD